MKYECTLCEYSTWDRMEISKHLKTHAASIRKAISPVQSMKRNPTTYSCFQCSFKTKSEKEISNHLLSHANSFHVCGICRRRFDSKTTLIKHQNIHENENGSFKTGLKNSQSPIKDSLPQKPSGKQVSPEISKSGQKHKSTKQNPSQCEVNVTSPIPSCSQQGPVAQRQLHSNIKEPASKSTMALNTFKSKKSAVPRKKFVKKSTIFFVVDPSSSGSAVKQSQVVGPQEETLYPCTYCDEVFASSLGLACHKENIHIYKCTVADCGKAFFDPAIFKAHMADHEVKNLSARK